MRTTKSFLLASAVAAACSQVLGIDGQYAPAEVLKGTGGSSNSPDAGTGGVDESIPPDIAFPSRTGAGGEGPGPSPSEGAGGAAIPPRADAGHQCAPGQKWCGACVAEEPSVGCNAPSCSACGESDPNGNAVCGNDGACDLHCNDGYVKDGTRCTKMPTGAGGSMGSGGSTGAGGSGGAPGSGGAGTGGRPEPCDPLECPACNRGFEGCCIPAAPGLPSRCGCFYFPPLCTARVG